MRNKNSTIAIRFKCLLASAALAFTATASAQRPFAYDEAWPVMDYAGATLDDPVTRLMAELDQGTRTLAFDADGPGYLEALLDALGIDPSSQLLVFSKTALKTRFVTARTPRALYFNDELYVGFTQNSRTLEIAAMDPNLGPVFLDFAQDPEQPAVERELNRCLRCHDTYSMTGGGVPRFLLSSVLADPEGGIVTHEISVITDTSVPLNRRWGGWFVTGFHGDQETMGNFVVSDIAMLRDLDLAANGNQASLPDYVDTGPYLRDTSDIVALLVIEHQVEFQNRLTRLNYEARSGLASEGGLPADTLAELARPLLESMFMAHEIPLTDTVTGTSGYAEWFQAQGPFDAQGRSLRELDLKTRTFKYPLSYLVYSRAFDALPDQVKAHLYTRMGQILRGEDADPAFAHLTPSLRRDILAILGATKADFPAGA